MQTMTTPKKPGMSAAAFRALVKSAGLSRSEAAAALGVNRRTVIRWATGDTPISARNAFFIRATLKAR